MSEKLLKINSEILRWPAENSLRTYVLIPALCCSQQVKVYPKFENIHFYEYSTSVCAHDRLVDKTDKGLNMDQVQGSRTE